MAAAGAELGKREREILRAIVQDYIHTGDPVASQPLLQRHDLAVSPATVRIREILASGEIGRLKRRKP